MARTVVATDDFSSGLGAWTNINSVSGAMSINSGQAQGSGSVELTDTATVMITAGTYSNDQYSKVAVTALSASGSNQFVMAICRCSGDVNTSNAQMDYYAAVVRDINASGAVHRCALYKLVNGVQTQLTANNDTIVYSNGDTVEIEAEGTTIRFLKNGVEQFSTTDSSLTSGKPGFGATAFQLVDNWEGGTLGSTDTTAPTLSSASVTSVGGTTATGNVTTDEGNGTLYSVVSTSATPPSVAQIQAGQNASGAAAVWSGNQAVSSTGAKNFSITGLANSTAYYAYFQHKDAAGNNSTVVSSAQFTTTSPPTITITDLKDLTTGTLRANETGITAIINNVTTGALVVKLTGLTSTAGGDMSISDAALVASTQYRVTIILSDGSEGTWKYTTS